MCLFNLGVSLLSKFHFGWYSQTYKLKSFIELLNIYLVIRLLSASKCLLLKLFLVKKYFDISFRQRINQLLFSIGSHKQITGRFSTITTWKQLVPWVLTANNGWVPTGQYSKHLVPRVLTVEGWWCQLKIPIFALSHHGIRYQLLASPLHNMG